MTTYEVRHETRYRYGEPVASSQLRACLRPRDTDHQRVLRTSVAVDHASEVADVLDAFGNTVTYVDVVVPHDDVRIVSICRVTTGEAPLPDGSPPWEEARRLSAGDAGAAAFTLPSEHAPRSPGLAAYAAPSFPTGRPLADAALALCTRIFDDFAFDATVTDVGTSVEEVLRLRRGVCQDFAHLMVGCLRSLGLAARYVSGYVETLPPPGQPKLLGADASHAWCSLFVPGFGWFDLDPTNDQAPPRSHVTIGWGRDVGDVSPVRGVILGPSTTQQVDVAVDVTRLPEAG
jgi:transglutaminase-like putative cysteine protease